LVEVEPCLAALVGEEDPTLEVEAGVAGTWGVVSVVMGEIRYEVSGIEFQVSFIE